MPEEAPADTTVEAETYAQAEQKLVQGEAVQVFLCDACVKAIEDFRRMLGN